MRSCCGTSKAIQKITEAQNKAEAEKAVKEFVEGLGTKWLKAAKFIEDEKEALLCCYDYTAEHWRRLSKANSAESPLASVRAKTYITTGPGSRELRLAKTYQLYYTVTVK